MPAEPDAVEIRVVACLVEKQRTTPDAYPLSLNALRLACNQSTNRDPVVDYDEGTVSDALRQTALRGWTRLASGAGSRARKYRHLLPEALAVDDAELNLLAVLMLRGAQTPGELKQRTERYQGGFADLGAVQEVLERLIERGYVIRHPRRPGQKEERYEQVLGGEDAVELVVDAPPAEGEESTPVADETARLDRLEADLLSLKDEIAKLRDALGG
ncbi:MAG: YceH family protein [Solirubrobacterales bacterium]